MDQGKSLLRRYMGLSAMTTGAYTDITTTDKFERNVPESARKKEQGRNEKCNCGSGLKYKKCCGR